MTFSEFFTELKNNPIWWDEINIQYGKKDLEFMARTVFADLVADGQIQKNDFGHFRKLYRKYLWYAPDKEVKPTPQKAEPVKIHPQALTGKRRLVWLRRFMREVNKIGNKVDEPVRERPLQFVQSIASKDGKTYTPLPPEEVYKRERHMEYIRMNYNARGHKKPEWIEEDEWNRLFDEGLT